MGKYSPEVDKYIQNSADFAKPILKHLRELIHKVCPEVEEKIKWGNPHLDYKGTFIFMAAFKQHAIFGFWKSTLMKDPNGLFKQNKDAMGSLGRLTEVSQLPSDKILTAYIKEGMRLNDEGKKVIVTKHAKPKLVVPSFIVKILSKNKEAKVTFDGLSPSHKREYVEWIMEAKREETKQSRIEKTIKMLIEGKSMNWEYEAKMKSK